jgi:S1-C subfamily serine protease
MFRKRGVCCLLIVLAFSSVLASAGARKPWLGMALLLRAAPSGGKFLYVAHAPEEAPAYRAGIRPGDLITRIDGKRIAFHDDLEVIEFSTSLTVGKIVKFRLTRAGKDQDIRVRIAALPVQYEELQAQSLRNARAARAHARE